jgi:hypothetical protein
MPMRAHCKLPWNSFARMRFNLMAMFGLIIFNAAIGFLWPYFGLRGNNGPALAPGVDYTIQWMPDADFRGLDATISSYYQVPGTRKSYVAGATWQTFRPYYVPTPDGKWHLELLARGPMNPYAQQSYLLGTIPAVTFSVIGLAICIFWLKPDRTGGVKEEVSDPNLA